MAYSTQPHALIYTNQARNVEYTCTRYTFNLDYLNIPANKRFMGTLCNKISCERNEHFQKGNFFDKH